MKIISDTICGEITADNIATRKTLFQDRYYTITISTLPRTFCLRKNFICMFIFHMEVEIFLCSSFYIIQFIIYVDEKAILRSFQML